MHKRFHLLLFLIFISVFLLQSCGSRALDDYSGERFELVNQEGEPVIFPDDFEGAPLVLGFIYTNCPDICSFITANVKKVYDSMDNPGNTRFVLVTFDPERDTPETLKEYAGAFGMDAEPFYFLSGEPEEINRFMDRMGVRVQESDSRESENGEKIYFLNHSDKILLIDQNSRLIFDYGGSMTPENIIIEDLEKL